MKEHFVSTDGVNWSDVPPAGANLRGITYGNSRFVACGQYYRTIVSLDGINWFADVKESVSSAWVSLGIAYGNNRFVAVGSGGYVRVSTDGVNWSDVLYKSLQGITYGRGKFVAVGNGGLITVSTDGVNWSDVVTSGATLYAVTSNSFKVEAPDN